MASVWLDEYESAVDLKSETRSLIQERNSKFSHGGPEASRITASARRRLGTLKSMVDKLQMSLESDDCKSLSENEKNRRRNMLSALRNDRDDMIKSLKRPVQNQALVGMKSKSVTGEETDETAEMNNAQLLQMQRALMEEQDEALGHLEQSVNTTKHVALQINEETQLQNRLLDELEEEVEDTSNRLATAQRHLKKIMRRADGCKAQILLLIVIVILILVLVLSVKIL